MRIQCLAVVITALATIVVQAQDPQSPVTTESKLVTIQPTQGIPPKLNLASRTKIYLTLEEDLSSATAHAGQSAQLGVAEDVKVGSITVVRKGEPATATVTTAEHDLLHGGKLAVSIYSVQLANGREVPVRALFGGQGFKDSDMSSALGWGEAVFKFPAKIVTNLFTDGRDVTFRKGFKTAATVSEDVQLDIQTFQTQSVPPVAESKPR